MMTCSTKIQQAIKDIISLETVSSTKIGLFSVARQIGKIVN